MSERAVYTIEVSWAGTHTGLFTIGTSSIGGTDKMAGDFGATDYDDISNIVKSIEISRGRSGDFQMMETGTCKLVLKDANGIYNPANAGSPLATYLKPMRPVRVRATYAGYTYGMFQGYITRIEANPDKNVQEATIECSDLFTKLNRARVTIAALTNATVDECLSAILDGCKVAGQEREIGVSQHIVPSYSHDATSDMLAEIEDLMLIDQGLCFVSGDGKLTYQPVGQRYAASAVAATLGDSLIGQARPSVSMQGIVNGQTVTKDGGTAQTYTDSNSQSAYGFCDGGSIGSDLLESDTQAMSLARFIVTASKDPRSPVKRVKLANSSATRLTHMLAREIGDIALITETAGGTSIEGPIEGINHRIWAGGTMHETTFMVRERPASLTFFTLGASTLGGSHIIGY